MHIHNEEVNSSRNCKMPIYALKNKELKKKKVCSVDGTIKNTVKNKLRNINYP